MKYSLEEFSIYKTDQFRWMPTITKFIDHDIKVKVVQIKIFNLDFSFYFEEA